MSTKKHAFVIASMGSGGAEHQLSILANGLIERGVDVTIITYLDIADHYELSPLIKRIRVSPGKSAKIKLMSLWKVVMTLKVDTIMTFSHYVSRILAIPLVFKQCNKVLGERCLRLYRPPIMERIAYRYATSIISNSYGQAEELIKHYPKLRSKVSTIINYTDKESYTPLAYSEGETIRFCVFARYNRQKNYERFADALKQVKSLTSIKFKVDWYGAKEFSPGKNRQEYDEFCEKIETLSIGDVIELKDAIKDVNNKMKEYNAFILPSLLEGFSNSLSEAICTGLPCLAGDISDNSLMVKNEVNGFLFDPFNINSIASSIIKFLSLTPKKRSTMSLKSREIAESLFDKEIFFQKYSKILGNKE